jgi:hypothetical protein
MNDVNEVNVNHVEAFRDAISQGVFIDEPEIVNSSSVHGLEGWFGTPRKITSWMYMGSDENYHFFKHSFTRENIKVERVEA